MWNGRIVLKNSKSKDPTYTEVVFNCRIKYSLKTNSTLYQIDFQLRHLTSKLVLEEFENELDNYQNGYKSND
jgi:hypothetical protein